ncbi:hypothetical protein PWT90_06986 [Aphanocladium album]|nr:hypothetical protein PWT90_06986 [Aphanocladium album]
MSTSVVEWPPVEVQSVDGLPDCLLGLLDWVRDEAAVSVEKELYSKSKNSSAALTANPVLTSKGIDDDGRFSRPLSSTSCQLPPDSRKSQEAGEFGMIEQNSSAHDIGRPVHETLATEEEEAKEKDATETIEPAPQDHDSPSPDDVPEQIPKPESVASVNSTRRKVFELVSKWKIPSEAIQDAEQLACEVKGSASSWSVSAIAQEPATPPIEDSSNQKRESSEQLQVETSPQIEELRPANSAQSHAVAAWLKETADMPAPKLVLPKPNRSSAHCHAIDPETGDFLPEIYHPETRFKHELDMQSEPGWRRGNITSDMQISRELKARARLAQRLKERLPTQREVETPVEEPESMFPRADCTIRPATDDDIAGIAEIINLELKAGRSDDAKPASAIRDWDMVKIFNKCKKERRPFIVATGGEDDLLDRSKWPADADRAYQEYVKYRSSSPKSQATIVGFAFAMPRQKTILETQDARQDHACYVTLFVHPNHRNKKYGSALLDRILMSVSPVHRSLIDFEWKCDEPGEIYEQPASNNAQQYARVFVEYTEAHEQDRRSPSRQRLLNKFGFDQVGHLSCSKSESQNGKRHWLDVFIWEFEAQSLENVR